jgi:hypothetical protein
MTDDEDLFHFEAPRWLTTQVAAGLSARLGAQRFG